MLSIFNITELPSSEPELLEWLWLNYLHEARGGSDEAATIVLAGLAWHLQQDTVSDRMRMILSDAFAAMADATPGPNRLRAAKEHLLFGRQPGSRPKYVAEKYELRAALAMWREEGDVSGKELNAACHSFLARRSSAAPDIRSLKRAYLKHRPAFRANLQGRNSV